MALTKAILDTFTKPNVTDLTSYVVPRMANGLGTAVLLGATPIASFLKEGYQAHNRAKAGRVTGASEPARLISRAGSGVPNAIKRISNGNYGVYADMAGRVLESQRPNLDTYGVTPQLVSALYNMQS